MSRNLQFLKCIVLSKKYTPNLIELIVGYFIYRKQINKICRNRKRSKYFDIHTLINSDVPIYSLIRPLFNAGRTIEVFNCYELSPLKPYLLRFNLDTAKVFTLIISQWATSKGARLS